MKLTYIFHSGFVLESDKCILVFDYWMDPTGVMSRVLASDKPVYVFSSHFHEDHFTNQIFAWKTKKQNITYLLSKDILRHRRAKPEEADAWLVKGTTWEDENILVHATGSNDSGVSWIVELKQVTKAGSAEPMRIFHAGDLCNWYARFLSEEVVPETILSEEFGRINPVAEEKQYLGELKDIRKIAQSFDIAMFPVDGRIGNGYTLGARQFIDRFQVGLFVPMHFTMSGFESAWRMEPFCTEKNIPFWSINAEGESITIADK